MAVPFSRVSDGTYADQNWAFTPPFAEPGNVGVQAGLGTGNVDGAEGQAVLGAQRPRQIVVAVDEGAALMDRLGLFGQDDRLRRGLRFVGYRNHCGPRVKSATFGA